MDWAETSTKSADKASRVSYGLMVLTLVMAGWLHLAAPLLAILFASLALNKLHFFQRWGKVLALVMFLILLSAVAYGLGYVINQAVRTLPDIADQAIPSIIQWAKQHQIELPFTDFDSLKDVATESVKSQVPYLGNVARIARGATTQFVFVILGIVVAISLFLHPSFELGRKPQSEPSNLYAQCCDQIAVRFTRLYRSFATVMGAQIIISAINTVFTAIFVLAVHLPHATVVIGLTFLCGLLPVIGNLISNSIIVGIGFTVSPRTALLALAFLIFIHKLEYFLNGKIIGRRIHNPLWLTLLALVVGERLMGLPGMVLAPVILHYIKVEASSVGVEQ